MKPSFTENPKLPLREIPSPLDDPMINETNSYLRTYRLGECTVIVTKEYGLWHLSIAHKSRLPTWDEIAEVRYRLLPDDITVAMLLPPMREYINLHKNCFQMHEIRP